MRTINSDFDKQSICRNKEDAGILVAMYLFQGLVLKLSEKGLK
jgi:hypothetical protein